MPCSRTGERSSRSSFLFRARRVPMVIRHEGFHARDALNWKDNPVLIGRSDGDRDCLQRHRLRVEHVMVLAVQEIDAHGFERLLVEQVPKLVPEYADTP